MIRVLLVDDHAAFREAMAFMLERQHGITVAAQAGSLAEARAVAGEDFDIALVDLQLPDGDGLALLPDLFGRHPAISVAILSGELRPERKALAIAAGAVGFLPKSLPMAEIIQALYRIAAGEPLVTAAEAIALMREAAAYQGQEWRTQRALAGLTPREREVLVALADGLSNEAIAERMSLTTATVRSHVAHLLRKLSVDSRLQAALIAIRHGLAGPGSRG